MGTGKEGTARLSEAIAVFEGVYSEIYGSDFGKTLLQGERVAKFVPTDIYVYGLGYLTIFEAEALAQNLTNAVAEAHRLEGR